MEFEGKIINENRKKSRKKWRAITVKGNFEDLGEDWILVPTESHSFFRLENGSIKIFAGQTLGFMGKGIKIEGLIFEGTDFHFRADTEKIISFEESILIHNKRFVKLAIKKGTIMELRNGSPSLFFISKKGRKYVLSSGQIVFFTL